MRRPGEITLALTVEGQEEIRQIFEAVYRAGLGFGRYYDDTLVGQSHLKKMSLVVDKALSEFFLKIAVSEEKDR